MKANQISPPTPAELGNALGAAIQAKKIVDAYVEHRAISAEDIRQFYEYLYELGMHLKPPVSKETPDDLECRQTDMLDGLGAADEYVVEP